MNRNLITLSLALALSLPAAAQSPVPQSMNFQGRLTKPDGTPVPDTNAQSVTFSLYTAPTGGSLLWTQTSANVPVHNGVFAAKLDFSTGFANGKTFAGTFATASVTPYLQIQVGSDAPLTPRQTFAANAYAFVANTALTVPDGSLTAAKFAAGVLNASGAAGGDLTGTYPNPSLITDVSLLPKVSGNVLSLAQEANPSVDQAQTNYANLTGPVAFGWQSFVPAQTQILTGIDFATTDFFAHGTLTALEIYAGEGTGGTLLYSTMATSAAYGLFQHVDFTGNLPTLQGGATYTIEFAGVYGQQILLAYADGNPYPAGRSDADPNRDYAFRTYARLSNALNINGSLSVAGSANLPTLNGTVTVTGGLNTGSTLYVDNGGGANTAMKAEMHGSNLIIRPFGAGASRAVIENTAGDIYFNSPIVVTGFTNISDARFKTNVQPLDNALENVLNLRGVSYDFDRKAWAGKRNFPAGRQIGFIAQDVEKIFPELVTTDREGYKSVAYQNAVPLLVEAIKTLNAKVDKLQTDNAELKKQNAALNEIAAKIERLEKAMQAKK